MLLCGGTQPRVEPAGVEDLMEQEVSMSRSQRRGRSTGTVSGGWMKWIGIKIASHVEASQSLEEEGF